MENPVIQSTGNVGSINTATPHVSAGGPHAFDSTRVMAPVANALGMTIDDLDKALDGGQTLNKIAAARGVARGDLIGAIKQGIHDATAEGGMVTSDGSTSAATGQLDKTVESIANGTIGTSRRHRHRHLANHPNTARLNKTSKMLHMTSTDLVATLKSGTSLTDLATRQGVSPDAAHQTVTNGMILNASA